MYIIPKYITIVFSVSLGKVLLPFMNDRVSRSALVAVSFCMDGV